MRLFSCVSDAMEESDVDDLRWLDAATAALADADESGRRELGAVLISIDHDFQLSRREHRAIREAVSTIPVREPLSQLHELPDDLADRLISVIAVCRRYRSLMAADPGMRD